VDLCCLSLIIREIGIFFGSTDLFRRGHDDLGHETHDLQYIRIKKNFTI
jgi:hypothetical protein